MKRDLFGKLRPCPFCQSDHADDWTWISEVDDKYMLLHYCMEKDKYYRVTNIYGSTPEECIERWNTDGKEHSTE